MKTRKVEEKLHSEAVANRYAIRSLAVAMVTITVVWLLVLFKVFLVDATVTTTCFVHCLVVYVIGEVVCKLCDISKSWVKYFILLIVVLFVTILNTFLTFHAILTVLLPIVYTSIYCNKKMMCYTYVLTVASIMTSVFVGYEMGICDANMTLLPGALMETYVNEIGVFTLTHVNDRVLWSLSLFFVLSRCIICAAFAVVSLNTSRIIESGMQYAKKMEVLAEIDGMTGLYNRSKYLNMVPNSYYNETQIAVIFWDINYLKQVNDKFGHEEGDKLILTVAESIRTQVGPSDSAYRIGGDEFIMIMRGADEKYAEKKLQNWKAGVELLQRNVDFPISVATGYAFGTGKELEEVIQRADQLMYENKKVMHERDHVELR